MIKGKKRETKPLLSVANVMNRISSYEVYRYFLGHDFKIGKPFNSPMAGRRDSSPSFAISNINGDLYHTDFGCMQWRGDCIDFVRQINHDISLQDALKLIDQVFGLGICSGEKFNIRTAPVYKIPKLEEKHPKFIQFTVRRPGKFNKIEQEYWNSYHCSFDILERENVFGVNTLYIDRQKFPLPKGEPIFGYFCPEIEKVKIYRPFANKEKKEWKWRSNIPFTHMFGLDKLQPAERVIIAKAQKCRIVLLHHIESVVAVQGESIAAINEESLSKIKSLSQEQYLNWGSDPQGKESSWQITTQLGIKHLNTPDIYLKEGINDMAELCKYYGHSALQEFLSQKGIIHSLKQTA